MCWSWREKECTNFNLNCSAISQYTFRRFACVTSSNQKSSPVLKRPKLSICPPALLKLWLIFHWNRSNIGPCTKGSASKHEGHYFEGHRCLCSGAFPILFFSELYTTIASSEYYNTALLHYCIYCSYLCAHHTIGIPSFSISSFYFYVYGSWTKFRACISGLQIPRIEELMANKMNMVPMHATIWHVWGHLNFHGFVLH